MTAIRLSHECDTTVVRLSLDRDTTAATMIARLWYAAVRLSLECGTQPYEYCSSVVRQLYHESTWGRLTPTTGSLKAVSIKKHRHAKRAGVIFCDRSIRRTVCSNDLLSYFFEKKKYLLVDASSMLWTGQWISESVSESVSQWVRDVCMSHQSDWIYYKQPIKFLVSYKGNLIFLFFTRSKFN